MASRIKVITTGSYAAGTVATAEVASSAPNGTLKVFSGTLVHGAIQISTVTFTATIAAAPVTATDNGSGVLSGSGVTGNINYTTGVWNLTYTTAPDNATNITCTYTWVASSPTQVTAESTGLSGAANVTKFRGKLAQGKIVPGSVTFKINFLTVSTSIKDNKNRELIHEKVSEGYINYTDGSFLIFFVNPPDTSASLTCDYKHRNSSYNDFYAKTNLEFYDTIMLYNATGSTIVIRILESDDDLTYVESSTVSIPTVSYKQATVNPVKHVRLLGWNNAGVTVEFYDAATSIV